MAQVTVVARIIAKPGMEDVVKSTLMELVEPTRKESGCINYDLHLSTDNKALFLFHENWASKKALDEHLAMPYLQHFLERSSEILAEPLDISLWERII
ncbi:MAG: putative quinol monooxygenase [Desulfomonilaceae bacterium]